MSNRNIGGGYTENNVYALDRDDVIGSLGNGSLALLKSGLPIPENVDKRAVYEAHLCERANLYLGYMAIAYNNLEAVLGMERRVFKNTILVIKDETGEQRFDFGDVDTRYADDDVVADLYEEDYDVICDLIEEHFASTIPITPFNNNVIVGDDKVTSVVRVEENVTFACGDEKILLVDGYYGQCYRELSKVTSVVNSNYGYEKYKQYPESESAVILASVMDGCCEMKVNAGIIRIQSLPQKNIRRASVGGTFHRVLEELYDDVIQYFRDGRVYYLSDGCATIEPLALYYVIIVEEGLTDSVLSPKLNELKRWTQYGEPEKTCYLDNCGFEMAESELRVRAQNYWRIRRLAGQIFSGLVEHKSGIGGSGVLSFEDQGEGDIIDEVRRYVKTLDHIDWDEFVMDGVWSSNVERCMRAAGEWENGIRKSVFHSSGVRRFDDTGDFNDANYKMWEAHFSECAGRKILAIIDVFPFTLFQQFYKEAIQVIIENSDANELFFVTHVSSLKELMDYDQELSKYGYALYPFDKWGRDISWMSFVIKKRIEDYTFDFRRVLFRYDRYYGRMRFVFFKRFIAWICYGIFDTRLLRDNVAMVVNIRNRQSLRLEPSRFGVGDNKWDILLTRKLEDCGKSNTDTECG